MPADQATGLHCVSSPDCLCKTGCCQRGPIVFRTVQILKCGELRINRSQLVNGDFSRVDLVKQETRPQSVGIEQLLHMYQDCQAIDGGERMMVLPIARDSDVVFAQQAEHPFDKIRHQQRYVATCGIDGVGSPGERAKSGRETFQWTAF